MASGGYRQPTNPAPVSGPGALAKRTDGGPGAQTQAVPSGLPYGERQALSQQEATAPMSASASMPPAPQISAGGGGGGQGALAQLLAGAGGAPQPPPFAESQRPNEPVTAGLPIGPGPGPEVMAVQHQPQYQAQGPMTQMLAGLSARDTTGVLADVYASAQALNV